MQFPCKQGFSKVRFSISIENVAVEIFFFSPLSSLEEMASSQEQNGCRLRILLVKCLKTLPAGIGHWNVLRNGTFYRNLGFLKHRSWLCPASGGCAQHAAGQQTPLGSCHHTASALGNGEARCSAPVRLQTAARASQSSQGQRTERG